MESFIEYCRLREAGLRKDAFRELETFITQASASPTVEQRRIVDWLMLQRAADPRAHHLLPHPLLQKVVLPVLRAWLADEPTDPRPARWLGILEDDSEMLQEALTRDPGDDASRAHRIQLLIRYADHATHHLSEGLFIGPVEDAVEALDSAKAEFALLREPSEHQALRWDIDALRRLLDDWQEYVRLAPSTPFRKWCESRGRHYDWWTIVYYTP